MATFVGPQKSLHNASLPELPNHFKWFLNRGTVLFENCYQIQKPLKWLGSSGGDALCSAFWGQNNLPLGANPTVVSGMNVKPHIVSFVRVISVTSVAPSCIIFHWSAVLHMEMKGKRNFSWRRWSRHVVRSSSIPHHLLGSHWNIVLVLYHLQLPLLINLNHQRHLPNPIPNQWLSWKILAPAGKGDWNWGRRKALVPNL